MCSVRFTPPSLFTFKASDKIEGTPPVDLYSHESRQYVYKESARRASLHRAAQ
jgi:hypothetical protein